MDDEFQAIVLAGGSGSRLTEIRGERAKCLLNVGPYPMIWYPLNLLQNHGFKGKDKIQTSTIDFVIKCLSP